MFVFSSTNCILLHFLRFLNFSMTKKISYHLKYKFLIRCYKMSKTKKLPPKIKKKKLKRKMDYDRTIIFNPAYLNGSFIVYGFFLRKSTMYVCSPFSPSNVYFVTQHPLKYIDMKINRQNLYTNNKYITHIKSIYVYL